MDTAGSNKTSAGDSECCSASRYVEATAMTHARWSAYDMGVGAASAREQSTVPLGPPPLPLAATAAPVRTVANSVAITEVVIRGEIERMCASFAGLSHRFDENAATPAGRAGPRGPGVEGPGVAGERAGRGGRGAKGSAGRHIGRHSARCRWDIRVGRHIDSGHVRRPQTRRGVALV